MDWNIEFTNTSEKSIRKLPEQDQIKILSFLKEKVQYSEDPRKHGKPLKGIKNRWRYRVNNFRIICNIIDKEVTIMVIKVGHRKNVYNDVK